MQPEAVPGEATAIRYATAIKYDSLGCEPNQSHSSFSKRVATGRRPCIWCACCQ